MFSSRKKKVPYPIQLLQRLAPRIGARVVLEPTWKIAGQIIFKNGHKRYFRYPNLGLNTIGASAIAKDKDYASYFMKRLGYHVVPKSKTFFRDSWAKAMGEPDRNAHAAYQYAQQLGFPVILKPNSCTQGAGVTLVHNKAEFYRAIKVIFKQDKIVIVQPWVAGDVYRFLVMNKKLLWAYRCFPLSVVGNGTLTILQLLQQKQKQFVAQARPTKINIQDPRIAEKLSKAGMNLETILDNGQQIFLLDNANLSAGGDSVDVTRQVHSGFKKIVVQLTKDMGLQLAGVDVVVAGSINATPKKYWILEINYAPGLDYYPETGRTDKNAVEKLYLQILKEMEKMDSYFLSMVSLEAVK